MNLQQKMRLGRRRAYLKRCIYAQQLAAEHETPTSVRLRVFLMYIQPKLNCSYVTYNNMLNEINPQLQLDDIENLLNNN